MSAPDQVFVASTAFGLVTMLAAIEQGLYGAAGRRILITSNNAAVPETTPEIAEIVGPELLAAFDDVYSYNAAVAPLHPSAWQPRAVDLPIWERHLRQSWALPDRALQLVVESIQAPPSLVLAQTFADARIEVYGDGLMSYGPTRVALPAGVAARIERLVHLDLVPGVVPLLLAEFDVPPVRIADRAFRQVVDRVGVGPDLPPAAAGSTAVLLGQYLAAAELLSSAEEDELHREMVRGAVSAGFRRLVFKPHPSAPPTSTSELVRTAAALGAELTVIGEAAVVERWFADPQIGLVVGCFSTALATAGSLYGLPTARVGTELVLRRLRPFQNSNRIPAVLVHLAVPALDVRADGRRTETGAPADADRLSGAVRAVGYAMQPEHDRGWRPVAAQALRDDPELARWIGQRRLRRLRLPGATPPRHPAKAALRRVLGPATYRRLGGLLRLGGLRSARDADPVHVAAGDAAGSGSRRPGSRDAVPGSDVPTRL